MTVWRSVLSGFCPVAMGVIWLILFHGVSPVGVRLENTLWLDIIFWCAAFALVAALLAQRPAPSTARLSLAASLALLAVTVALPLTLVIAVAAQLFFKSGLDLVLVLRWLLPLALLTLASVVLLVRRIMAPLNLMADALAAANQSGNAPPRGEERSLVSGHHLAEGVSAVLRRAQDAENAAADARQRLARKLALGRDWIWETDAALTLTRIDAGARAYAVQTRLDRFLGESLQHLLISPLQGLSKTEHEALLRSHRPFVDLELHVPDAHGKTRAMVFAGEPLFDSKDAAFRGYHGVARDVTSEREGEFQLLLYRTVFDHVDDCVLVTSPDLDKPGPTILAANAAFCAMCGYQESELLGRTPRMLQGQDTDRMAMDELKIRLARGEPFSGETTNYRKFGQPYRLQWMVWPVRDTRGAVQFYMSVQHETSKLHEHERQMETLAASLEQRVRERTYQLELVAKELESFSFTVSHDLKAPLRVIEGFTEIMREDYGPHIDQIGNDHLNRILSATQRMNEMMAALYNLARTAGSEMSRETINLSKLIEEIAGDLNVQDPARTVKMNIESSVRVEGDRVLLRIALENLLGNAWKFTSKRGDPLIEFGVISRPQGLAYFVRDNGAGFDMRFAERLFGIFQRLHRASEFQGTGIGLATVQRIVRRHGGRIWAESEPGRGATFYFTLWETPENLT